ncbi:MAG: autotransporter domain-containing protein [Rhodoplanes sp.]|uniref:autotransporter outer membrane beta-barrel domain-containing protein n=1 Tax=Rhodoplanes sp. TaxID=1968906 RepID=UPI0017FC0355|nr:autotransporter outer membrane beta-barrel domain-containing protein [Rhodoplanes sp.]NVO14528.1 autotransporter domain-containing protein [Rhodoplanes sp.]
MNRPMPSRDLRTLTTALLTASALVPLAGVPGGPAFAVCTIVGGGSIGNLASNATATCTGAGDPNAIATAAGSSNVTINIGDGTAATTFAPGAGPAAAIYLNGSPNAIVTVTNNAELIAGGRVAIWGLNDTNDATVTIAAGGLVSSTNIPAIRFDGTAGTPLSGLDLRIDGTVSSNFPAVVLTYAVDALITVGATGSVGATGVGGTGIILGVGANNNTVSISAGGLIEVSGGLNTGVSVSGDGNLIVVGGTIKAIASDSTGVSVTAGAAGNTIWVLPTGSIQSAYNAVSLGNGGNAVVNGGTLTSTNPGQPTIQGSSGSDIVINSGLISNLGGGVAIDLGGGADTLELRAGYQIVGAVLGGGGENLLRFGGDANATFDMTKYGPGKQYQGFSILEKQGASTWVLTGDSNTTSELRIQQGALLVNGNLGNLSNVEVTGGILGGSGTVGSTTIHAGGTLAPGSSIGTLTVNGTLTFQPGSVYQVEVSPAAADRTNVTGAATLAGTVAASFAPGNYITRHYTILSAGGGLSSTKFDALATTNLPVGFTAALSYGANDVFLDLTGALGAQSGALPINQTNVANAINAYFNNGGALPPGFVGLFGLGGGNLANALATLDGEASTGAQQAGIRLTNQFLALMLDPLAYDRNAAASGRVAFAPAAEASAYAPQPRTIREADSTFAAALKAPPATPLAPAPAFTMWAGAFGGTSRTDGDRSTVGSNDLSARTAGYAAGIDHRLWPDTVVGFALAGGSTDWGLAQGLGGGRGDAFQAGLYGSTRVGDAYLAAAASYARHWMETNRTAWAADRLTARFDAQGIGGRLEAGWRIATAIGGMMPYGAVQIQSFHTPAYTEADPTGGGFGLSFRAHDATAARSEVGARFEHRVALSESVLVAMQSRVAWAHDWVSDPTATAVFQTLPGAAFVVNGAVPAADLALVSAGMQVHFAGGWSVVGRFDGEFADGARTFAGTGSLRYAW